MCEFDKPDKTFASDVYLIQTLAFLLECVYADKDRLLMFYYLTIELRAPNFYEVIALNCLRHRHIIIDLLATNKSQLFAQPRVTLILSLLIVNR